MMCGGEESGERLSKQDAHIRRSTQLFNFPVMLLMILLTDRRVTRREGAVLLAVYAMYLAGLITVDVIAPKL